MTSAQPPTAAARGAAVLRSLISARTGRATWDAITALGLVFAGLCTISLVLLVGGAAASSLVSPDPRRQLPTAYVLVTVGGPIPVLWTVQGFATLQRLRLYQVLGVEIPRPKRRTGLGPWPIGPWRSGVTWREVKYHAVNLLVGGVGATLVLLCFAAPALAIGYTATSEQPLAALAIGYTATSEQPLAALAIMPAVGVLLAAPWAARTMSGLDARLGRALLGPAHGEALMEQVQP